MTPTSTMNYSPKKFKVPYISLDGDYLSTETKLFSAPKTLEESSKTSTLPKEETYAFVRYNKSSQNFVYVIKDSKPIILSQSEYLKTDIASYNPITDVKDGRRVPSRDKDGHILLEVNSVSSKSSDSGYSSDCCEAFCCCLEISLRLVTCFCEIADACNK